MFAELPIMEPVREWDRQLLLNRPRLWALRLPVLLAYFVVFNGLAALFIFLFPWRTYQVNNVFFWLWLFGVLELIALGFWIWRFSWFSPEKGLERTSPLNGLWEILIYMLCVFIFLSPTVLAGEMLRYRFYRILPAEQADRDHRRVTNLNFRDYYPQDIVERYSPIDYETYRSIPEANDEIRDINSELRRTVYLISATNNSGESEWNLHTYVAIIFLHVATFMFNARHNRRGLLGKTVAYGLLIVVAAFVLQGLLYGFFAIFRNFASLLSFGIIDNISRLLVLFLLLFVSFFSARVYWQRDYRTFTALNISILPFVVYYQVLYWGTTVLDNRYRKTFKLVFGDDGILNNSFGEYWGETIQFLILGSPVLIAVLFILLKSMYRRLLVLPER